MFSIKRYYIYHITIHILKPLWQSIFYSGKIFFYYKSFYFMASKNYCSVFKSVIIVVFQSVFHSEKHADNIFYFLKIIFKINTSK